MSDLYIYKSMVDETLTNPRVMEKVIQMSDHLEVLYLPTMDYGETQLLE